MKLNTSGLCIYIFLYFFTTSGLLYTSDDIDRLTAFLHPGLANKIRQELLPSTQQKSIVHYPSLLNLQRHTNSPELNSQAKIDLLALDMKFLNLQDTETNIDAAIKNNDEVNAVERKILTSSYISKAAIISVIGSTAQAINSSMQQMKRAENPRFIPFDPAAITSLAGQAAKPILIGSLILGGVCYIEHIIRARDLNEIEHLKQEHEREKKDLTQRMIHLSDLIRDTKLSISNTTENVTELRASYDTMKSLLITQIMPKVEQLLEQIKIKKAKIKADLITLELSQELDNLKIELESEKNSECNSIEENSTNISSQESKAAKHQSIQGALHKGWKITSHLFTSHNDQK